MSDELRAFVHFWRQHGTKDIEIINGVASTRSTCVGEYGGCCSDGLDFGGLFDAIVELGGWTADTDHEHRWGSKRGQGWRLCRVPGCRMYLPAQETLDSWPEGQAVPPARLPDDYDDSKAKDEPCQA